MTNKQSTNSTQRSLLTSLIKPLIRPLIRLNQTRRRLNNSRLSKRRLFLNLSLHILITSRRILRSPLFYDKRLPFSLTMNPFQPFIFRLKRKRSNNWLFFTLNRNLGLRPQRSSLTC